MAQMPAAAAKKKKEPGIRDAAKRKPSTSATVIYDDEDNEEAEEDFDDDNFEIEEVAATLAANKKGGRKPAAAATRNKRGPAKEQLLGQTLLTEIFKPAETLGISPEKKVKKMRESPFNKISGSVLGKSTTREDEVTAEIEENSGSGSDLTNSNKSLGGGGESSS